MSAAVAPAADGREAVVIDAAFGTRAARTTAADRGGATACGTAALLPCRIVVMAKAPLAGYAKTRLVPALGADGAAALAGRLLAHAVREARGANLGAVELRCAPDAGHEAFRALAGEATTTTTTTTTLAPQGDGDLGERMARAFADAFAAGERRVLLIGTDAPALDAAMLRRAAAALDTAEAVFVPALDGGYALVGLRRAVPALFASMTWSCDTVMRRSRERAADAGIVHVELPAVADIDEPADLVHLPAGWGA